MGQLTFIIGGAGSGKSKFAVEFVQKLKGEVAFVATATPKDDEMKRKIKNHQKERPSRWQTIEAASAPFEINDVPKNVTTLLVDSITLWTSELLLKKLNSQQIRRKCSLFLEDARSRFKHTIIVSDEVGLGIVPENSLARTFREVQGIINQQTAQLSNNVFLVTAGLPIQLKGELK